MLKEIEKRAQMWGDINRSFRSLMRKCNLFETDFTFFVSTWEFRVINFYNCFFRLLKGPSYKDRADVINLT